MRNRMIMLGISAPLFLAGPVIAASKPVQYACTGGTRLSVTFSPPGVPGCSAALKIGRQKEQLVLPQVLSADGGRYARGDMQFWIKGQNATFTQGDRTVNCTSRKAKSLPF